MSETERILFVVPPNTPFNDFVNPPSNARVIHKKNGDYGSVLTEMPLGIFSLSAYLKKHAIVETRLVDFNIELNTLDEFIWQSFEQFFRSILSLPEIIAYAPSIIGVSTLFTPAYRNMLDIGQLCRELFPGAMIIAGGCVPTNMYKEIYADNDCFDALCYGEGEKLLLDLVTASDKQAYLDASRSWITRDKVWSGESFQHDFIECLDEIPFSDYDICDADLYGLNPAVKAYPGVDGKGQNFYIMTSRGCPHRCCFCGSHTVHGRTMRYYSVERIRDDLTRLRDEYGAKIIIVQDDNFMANKARALEIIGIIKELELVAVFQTGLALYALDRKTLAALKGAGVHQLFLPVESGSERVLKEVMHKPLNLSVVKKVVDNCRDLGIYANANILIGLPGETKQDIEDARAFLKTVNANWFMILIATPLVGTEMLDICLANGYLQGDYTNLDYKKANVTTEEFTAEYIQEMAYIMNLELNFVENSDFRLGNYADALKGFENAIRAKDDHAIAYYCAARCYEQLGNHERAGHYMSVAKRIAGEDPFWRKYADMFYIPI